MNARDMCPTFLHCMLGTGLPVAPQIIVTSCPGILRYWGSGRKRNLGGSGIGRRNLNFRDRCVKDQKLT